MVTKQKRQIKCSFLSGELKENLRQLFGDDFNSEKILEFWENIRWAGMGRYKYKFDSRLRDAALSVGLIDNGELRKHEFYRGAIAGILSRYRQSHEQGADPNYVVPIAYCFSRLEELAKIC